MNSFSAAGMVWAIIIILAGISYTVGYTASSKNTYSECRDFGKIKVSKFVYECKLIENKSK